MAMRSTVPGELARMQPRRRRRGFGLIVLAFAVMLLGALALMVRFSGSRPHTPAPVPSSAPPPALVGPSGLAVPVAGVGLAAIQNSWGDARGGGTRAHHGTDIMASADTPVLAAGAGTVEKLFDSGDGGHTIYIRSPDGRWSYYYAHLARYADGLYEGQQVPRGQPIGYVGDTGNAGPGNYHLHFGISRMKAGDDWAGGQSINPYPLLVGAGAGR